tara:strand:- start:97 stop:240 length:144 start_codon:yes stop_codon:yes gene_type:complete
MKIKEKDFKELISLSSLYNFWDITSLRMALDNIKNKLKEIEKNENKL